MKNVRRGISAYQKGAGKAVPKNPEKEKPPRNSAAHTGKRPASRAKAFDLSKLEGFVKSSSHHHGPGANRAAKFLMLLGKEDASNILKHLSPVEVERLLQEIVNTGAIDREEAKAILADFGLRVDKGRSYYGGAEKAREMLIAAYGEEQGEKYFRKFVPHAAAKPFSFLNDYEFQQILMILKREPPSVLGVVLSYLEPGKAAKIIESLSPSIRKQVIMHLAAEKKLDFEVLERMEEVIKEKIRTQGKVVSEEIDGKSALAGILKHMGMGAERTILEDLEKSDPELYADIKDRLFGEETLLHLDDRGLQEVLRDYGDSEIALILKGKSEEIRHKLLANVSERRRALIEDEALHLGTVKRSDVEKATKEFLKYLQEQVLEGKLILLTEPDVYV
ncbi:MAG: flagellar motor switch protein FliG [Spirochaetia bacterium]